MDGGSMERNSGAEMGQSGEADRCSQVSQEAQGYRYCKADPLALWFAVPI